LIAINALVYILMVAHGVSPLDPKGTDIVHWGGQYGPFIFAGQWWRLLTAVFVHVGRIHIFMNMLCLWGLGPLAEKLMGRVSFFFAYLLTGVAGNLLSLWHRPNGAGAGASGAIFGVAGILITLLNFGTFNVPREALKPLINRVVRFAAINLLIGLSVPIIDNSAHLGGLLCGLAIGAITAQATRMQPDTRRAAHIQILAGCAAILAAAGFGLWKAHH